MISKLLTPLSSSQLQVNHKVMSMNFDRYHLVWGLLDSRKRKPGSGAMAALGQKKKQKNLGFRIPVPTGCQLWVCPHGPGDLQVIKQITWSHIRVVLQRGSRAWVRSETDRNRGWPHGNNGGKSGRGGQAEPQQHLQLKARCQETEHTVASF